MSRPLSRGGRPGTGGVPQQRLSTGGGASVQVPATPGQTAGSGVSLNTEVNVASRPVTQQGMMGQRIATAGPGRQVQDSSYYFGRLTQKTQEIKSEIERLTKELEQHERNKSQVSQLERKVEVSLTRVRELECELADHNLAMDNCRSRSDPEDIRETREKLSSLNASEESFVDQLFITRQEKESRVHQLEDDIRTLHRQHASRIEELAPEKYREYQTLLQEHEALERELGPKIQELDFMTQQIAQRQEQLASDPHREQYQNLEKSLRQAKQEVGLVTEDLKLLKMDPEEARVQMLARVKKGKAEVQGMEKEVAEAKAECAQLQQTLTELQSEMANRQQSDNADDKYELLAQRDQEMTTYLESVESLESQLVRDTRKSQETIVALLEHLSQQVTRELPEEDEVLGNTMQNMQSDLAFKEKQLESSAQTKGRLEKELVKRQQELEKVNSLDDKISIELRSLEDKLESMAHESETFEQLDTLKDESEQAKQRLQRLKQKYIRRRDAIVQQVHKAQEELQENQHQLNDLDTTKNLESLEQKIRHYEQTIFHLKQFIDTKHREDNYETVKAECLQMVEDLNCALMKEQSQAPVRSC